MRSKKFLSVCVVCAVAVAAMAGCSLLDAFQPSGSSSGSVSTSSSESSSAAPSSSSASQSSQSSSSSSSSSQEESSSQSSSPAPSSSSSSSSQVQAVTWNGNYLASEGSASQINLTISGQTETEFVFEFYLKGIDYSGTAKLDAKNSSSATFTDPNHSDYSLTFKRSDSGITVTESGTFPDANCSFGGNFAAR